MCLIVFQDRSLFANQTTSGVAMTFAEHIIPRQKGTYDFIFVVDIYEKFMESQILTEKKDISNIACKAF